MNRTYNSNPGIFLQTWHIPPRNLGLKPKPATSLVVQKATKKSSEQRAAVEGVTPKCYNAVHEPLSNIRLDRMLVPFMEVQRLQPQFFQLWDPVPEEIEYTTCQFGEVPKGSLLSYQLKEPASTSGDITPIGNIAYPLRFNFPHFERAFVGPLDAACDCFYGGLFVAEEQSHTIESETKGQSNDRIWHDLRKPRITATSFKRVCSRRGDFDKLARDMVNMKNIQTAAMKSGIEKEPAAVKKYCNTFSRNAYRVGLAINPSLPYLGCSPDRRVFDPDAISPYGLLEVKTTAAQSVTECRYLTQDRARASAT